MSFFLSWTAYDWIDPADHLKWLAGELLKAEEAGEKVHILSHVPPGKGECIGAWGRAFTQLVNRHVNHLSSSVWQFIKAHIAKKISHSQSFSKKN